ncbi:hypothetical protein CSKR_112569 [Clonorchis sinensis]|uniref:Uncharacterized protein n=1 Tax=Clonorchis sinensis TaxID=79923 RepID=A0A419Q9X6_CLOSI|nr:hypothetical protein CSKR_112569 [Clonorchis sinensis]
MSPSTTHGYNGIPVHSRVLPENDAFGVTVCRKSTDLLVAVSARLHQLAVIFKYMKFVGWARFHQTSVHPENWPMECKHDQAVS